MTEQKPPPLNLAELDFTNYVSSCPTTIGESKKSAFWIKNSLLLTESVDFSTLKFCVQTYCPYSKLNKLSNFRHNVEDQKLDSITMRNCSFYVAIGARKGYERMLDQAQSKASSQRNHSPFQINLMVKKNYSNLFCDFYFQKFNSDESASLDKCFQLDNIVTISIFARHGYRTEAKRYVRFQDQLIGAASFVMDKNESVLLLWLGVTSQSLSELKINDAFVDETKPIQTHYNLGRLLLVMCQHCQSLRFKKWCPIVCQVHQNEKHGPIRFYLKNFFIQMKATFQLVWEQYLHRSDLIINDDKDLTWLVLLFPLKDLLMTDILRATNWNAYYSIIVRGFYYFLNRKQPNSTDQDNIGETLRVMYNYETIEELVQSEVKLDVSKNIIDDQDSYARFFDDDTPPDNKPLFMSACAKIFDLFCTDSTTKKQLLFLQNCGYGQKVCDMDSLFLSISQIIYGNNIFYLNLRQFLVFYYRSLSLLHEDHPFYYQDEITLVLLTCLNRMYGDNIPSRYFSENMELNLSKKKEILSELSIKLCSNQFCGDYQDISIFAAIFGYEFIICEGRSNQFIIANEDSTRKWAFTFKSLCGDVFIKECLHPTSILNKKWIACFDEEYFLPFSTDNEYVFQDLTMLPNNIGFCDVGKQDVVNLMDSPLKKKADTNIDLTQYLPSVKVFSGTRLRKAYYDYVDAPSSDRYLGKGRKCIPDFDGTIGPMFEYDDFVNAHVPEEFILPCMRCAHPFTELVIQQIKPIEGECTYKDLFHLRPETCICDGSARVFIQYLGTLTDNYFFFDPYTYNNTITSIRLITNVLAEREFDLQPRKDILVMLHLSNHFIVIEIQRSKRNKQNKIPVAIADSMCKKLDILTQQIQKERFFHLFLHMTIATTPYEFVLADNVFEQSVDSINDCGIICLQRMYAYALFNNPSITLLPDYLQNIVQFRCFILYKSLEFKKSQISQFIMIQNDDLIEVLLQTNIHNIQPIIEKSDQNDENIIPKLVSDQPPQIEDEKEDKRNKTVTQQNVDQCNVLEEQSDPNPVNKDNESNNYSDTPIIPTTKYDKNRPSTSVENDTEDDEERSSFILIGGKVSVAKKSGRNLQFDIQDEAKSISSNNVSENDYEQEEGDNDDEENTNERGDGDNNDDDDDNKQENEDNDDDDNDDDTNENQQEEGDNNDDDSTNERGDGDNKDDDDDNEREKGDNNDDDDNDSQSFSTVKESDSEDKTTRDKDDVDFETRASMKKIGKHVLKFKVPKTPPISRQTRSESKTPPFSKQIRSDSKTTEKSPTRSSSRIKEKHIYQEEYHGMYPPIENTKKKRVKEPVNVAIGFKVRKKPKQLTDKDEAWIQKNNEALNAIREREKRYDEFEDTFDFEDPTNEEFIDDLYSSNEWYFIDKKMKATNYNSDEKRNPQTFLPLLYNDCQHNSEKAAEAVESYIEPELDSANANETLATKQYEKMKKKYTDNKAKRLLEAKNKLQNATIEKTMLELEVDFQNKFLPYDSIHALQPITSKSHENITDYYVAIKNPNGRGYKRRLVSAAWVNANVESEFVDQIIKHHKQKGWTIFSEDENNSLLVKDTLDIPSAVKDHDIDIAYTYEPLRNNDQILILRCVITYDMYSNYNIVKKANWSILTKKQSMSDEEIRLKDIPDDPLAVDLEGNRQHKSKYYSVTENLLQDIMGDELLSLFKQACVLAAADERRTPCRLSAAPKFEIVNKSERKNIASKVSLSTQKDKRYYDEMDVNKNGKHVMPISNIGAFMYNQFYYFDLREFDKSYFVNVSKTQISGLKFNQVDNKFYGLEKLRGTYREVMLEEEWVEINIPSDFIDIVRRKSLTDDKKFCKLPVGCSKPLSRPDTIVGNPLIKYRQDGRDNCVFTSLANALDYMGFDALAYKIAQFETTFMENHFENQYDKCIQLVTRKVSDFGSKQFNKRYCAYRIKNPMHFDLISNAKKNPTVMYHVVVSSVDGSSNHCICVFNNYIFDGNYTNAWILSRESLFQCLNSEFAGVENGYMYLKRNK